MEIPTALVAVAPWAVVVMAPPDGGGRIRVLPLVNVHVVRPRAVEANVPVRLGLALAVLGVALAACRGDGGREAVPDLRGHRAEVVAVWQGAEATAFEQVLQVFEDRTGATVTYTSTAGEDITAVLDRRLEADDPPQVVVLPQPGLLTRYAESGEILPIADVVGDEVRAGWAPRWQELGSVDGVLYGVWFKAANKSLIWYSIGTFERHGLVPPDDVDGLVTVARALAAGGIPAFSVTGAASDAWTLTDWFENLYLRLAGPEWYDALAAHRIPWTDPTVAETLRVMADLLGPGQVLAAAGPETSFPESVAGVFAAHPSVAMVMEGDFVPGVVATSTDAEVGIDVDVFAFPGRAASDRFVIGGGDVAVLMQSTPASDALLRYLASTDAGEVWAAIGGFVSPNEDLDLTVYPDATTRRIARSLLEAGDEFRFDLSDLQPAALGGTTGQGMWAALTDFVAGTSDLERTMARLEADASAAWASP
jgi:alpha-glucoside transport system substrate-binding protein